MASREASMYQEGLGIDPHVVDIKALQEGRLTVCFNSIEVAKAIQVEQEEAWAQQAAEAVARRAQPAPSSADLYEDTPF